MEVEPTTIGQKIAGTDAALFGKPRDVELKGLSNAQRVYRVAWAPSSSK